MEEFVLQFQLFPAQAGFKLPEQHVEIMFVKNY